MKLHGHITDTGELKLPDRAMLQNWIASNKGKNIELEIKRKRKKRSNDQNEYYWAGVVPKVCEALRHLGHDVDEQDTHDFLKAKFNSVKIANKDSVVEELPQSTTKLTTVEMMDYIAKIQMWAAEYLGIVIPDPNTSIVMFSGTQVNGTDLLIAERG
jgi:hypothetical protein